MFNEEMYKDAEKYGFEYYKKGRVLVWHDEFDKPQLDMDKWVFYRTMSHSDREFDNSEKNVRIEDNKLLLQVNVSEEEGKSFSLPEGLTTKYTMNWKYGYLEMRAKIPYRKGAWPSFWTQSSTVFQKACWMCETDIFEVFSSTKRLYANIHKWEKAKHTSESYFQLASNMYYDFEDFENLNNEYHVYGYEWDPEFMTFYIDGKQFARFAIDPINGNFGYDVIDGVMGFHDFQFVIVNNEIFTNKNGWIPRDEPITPEDAPVDYYIDWIRLYQNPEKEEIKLKPEIDEVLAAKKAEEEAKNK